MGLAGVAGGGARSAGFLGGGAELAEDGVESWSSLKGA